ncbi:MAG TPA: AmmeMemoRadiSam system protein B [Anaerolineae bacterium]|nr:AmmeMemoRadiSam system protein B [Anaerolineae bacterium]HQK13577.1 AmmeMemoRadiSam system protein B [Anaerolineae bacterium]
MAKTIRPAAVAGMFYPDAPNSLRKDIGDYLNKATPPALTNVRAVIAPHAGYVYSGPVAAYAYKVLAAQPTPPKRIYLMGPSHRVWFSGVALADYTAFNTPLGNHPLDVEKIETLAASGDPFAVRNAPHAPEHCLEVHIPFLQVVLPETPVIPILFGDVDPVFVGERLNVILEPEDLLIVSSDLSHYHDNRTAHALDRQFVDAVLAGDLHGAARGEACGQAPAIALMIIAAKRGWRAHLLDYRTSGDVTGDTGHVVGYAAIAYVEETL